VKRPVKKPRKKYKALYLEASFDLKEAEDRLAITQRRLGRYQKALAVYGKRVCEQFDRDADCDILLPEHEFTAYEATLLDCQRFAGTNDETWGEPPNLAWRNRKVRVI